MTLPCSIWNHLSPRRYSALLYKRMNLDFQWEKIVDRATPQFALFEIVILKCVHCSECNYKSVRGSIVYYTFRRLYVFLCTLRSMFVNQLRLQLFCFHAMSVNSNSFSVRNNRIVAAVYKSQA